MRKFVLVEIMASKEKGHRQELEPDRIPMKSLQDKKGRDCFENSFNCVVLKIGQGIKLASWKI